jgi:glycosyltransferase involved in cell wall biosynthesis
MKILLTHRYFWPDSPPYALMLRVIGESLAGQGHDVHVFTTMPSYREHRRAPGRERLGELHVHRVRAFAEAGSGTLVRVLNVMTYCIALFAEVLRVRPDLVTAATFPPVVAAWSASLAARLVGARFVYHMQDIHPEVSKFSGDNLGRGLAAGILTALDNSTLRRSSAVIVLSSDMAETLRSRGLADLPIRIINNFSLDLFGRAVEPPAEYRKAPGKRRVIFAGNLGRFQNLPLLAEGVSLCFERYPELELFFLGDGRALADLKERWRNHPQVRFGPFLPVEQANALIAEADVGLVSLVPGMYRVAYPSKVLTYLGLGVPVLALIEPQSELARDLVVQGRGSVPHEPTAAGVAAALADLLAARRDVVAVNLRESALEKWSHLVNSASH